MRKMTLTTFNEASKRIENLRGALNEKIRRRKELQSELVTLQKDLPDLKYAILLARTCLDQCLEIRTEIQSLVQSGIQECFQIPYRFVAEPQLDDNNMVKGVKLLFASPNGQLVDPRDDFSAGVVEAGAILLQLTTLIMIPGTQPILVSDEGITRIAAKRRQRFGQYLQKVCTESGAQMILITHDAPIGDVYMITKSNEKRGEVSYAQKVERKTDSDGQPYWAPIGKQATQ